MRFKLSIMVLTQPSRAKFLRRLLDVLDSQVAKFPNDVHVDVRMFDKNLDLGTNREVMRQDSMGSYLCFVDDDDLLPDDYVSTILPLLDGVDQIGFRVSIFIDGIYKYEASHSLRHSSWTNSTCTRERDISHVNPMRRELALLCPMEGGVAEDFRWAAAMRATGKVKTEHFIDRVMYHYLYRANKGSIENVVQKETEVRLDELDLAEKNLNWINSMRDYFIARRPVIPELKSCVVGREARLDEVRILDRFDDYPVRKYIERRLAEIEEQFPAQPALEDAGRFELLQGLPPGSKLTVRRSD